MAEYAELDKSPVWARLVKAYQERIQVLLPMAARPLEGTKDMLQHNVVVGEIAGLSFALQFPQMEYERAKELLDNRDELLKRARSTNLSEDDVSLGEEIPQ